MRWIIFRLSQLDKNQKEATINPLNKKEYVQYAVIATLNHGKIEGRGGHPEGITKNKSFKDRYNWKGINYWSEKDNWKKSEKNNLMIAHDVSYIKIEKIYPGFVLKHNSNCKKQVNLSMIPNGER